MDYEVDSGKIDSIKITRKDFNDLAKQFLDKDCCAAIIAIKKKTNPNRPKTYKKKK